MSKLNEKRINKQFARQRKEKGYADCDAWEMRTWFLQTARPILLEMAVNTDNHPHELEFEQWREILERMAKLLELMDIWDDTALRKELQIPEGATGDDVTIRLNEKRNEAKDEFFSLFNRWFFDLWY